MADTDTTTARTTPPQSWTDDGGPRPTARWAVLASRADIVDAIEALGAALQADSQLSPRHRMLALLAVTRRSEFEQQLLRPRASRMGFGAAEFEAVDDEDWTAECLDDSDRIVFRYAMMFDAGHGIGSSVSEALRAELNDAQVVELCALCAHAGGLARLAIALGLQAGDAGGDP